MIYGIGIDLVSVARMRKNIDRFGLRFAGKILSPEEMREYRKLTEPAGFLARRFAAKEALAKALGTGLSNGITLKCISINHAADGQPVLSCTGKIPEILAARGICKTYLSITDEQEYACACVILEKAPA